MTVQYTTMLITKRYFGFPRLLFTWRGSIYKLLWKDMLLFLMLYYAIHLMYTFILPEPNKRVFHEAVVYCNSFSNLLPLSFVLGFFVSRVYSRFWEQMQLLPWPVRPAMYVSSYVRGRTDACRMVRRTILRYLVLSLIMTFTSISTQAKRRFPTLNHLTEAGFLLPKEQEILEKIPYTGNKYFIPCVWAAAIVERARQDGKVKDDLAVQKLLSEINDWRGACGGLIGFDSISVPLVYTQVITVAVYIFVVACLIGRRQTDDGFQGDFNFPFFTIVNIVTYVGWMKVAEALFNPFGDDDDDFEVNALIDRHLREAYLVVDTIYEIVPEMIQDLYWNKTVVNLPYTQATQHQNKTVYLGSAADIVVSDEGQQIVSAEERRGRRSTSVFTRNPRSSRFMDASDINETDETDANRKTKPK